MMSRCWDGSWGTLIAAAAQGSIMERFIWICALANRRVFVWVSNNLFFNSFSARGHVMIELRENFAWI